MSDFPWTTPDELIAQVRKHWDSGRLLGERFEDSPLFPLKLRTRTPARAICPSASTGCASGSACCGNTTGNTGVSATRSSGGASITAPGVGNDLPKRIVIPSREDALKMIGKTRAAATFDRLADDLLADFPQLGEWLARRPLVALARADDLRSRRCWVVSRPSAARRTCANSIFPAWVHPDPSPARRRLYRAISGLGPVLGDVQAAGSRLDQLPITRPSIGTRSAFACSSSATG